MSQQPGTPSGDIAVTAGSAIRVRPGYLVSLSLTPAAAASTVVIYDNALGDTSGTVIARLAVQASVGSISLPIAGRGIAFNKGMSAVVTGSGAVANLAYVSE